MEECKGASTPLSPPLSSRFAVERRIDKVSVFTRRCAVCIPRNTITYNAMLDEGAKCGTMQRASSPFGRLAGGTCGADIITYSTFIKGYCFEGDFDRALQSGKT